ncbi:hypothetical protein TrVE_jg2450 [Triparma verrucosa]|uniref:Uncharacterized protein n=1 Tax=Triparma verrucosa TaxID=1606542 RepID=A0A9W7C7E4_9STRA|nr:hypothetical protein TrVE_jg2450 [Triparma verrucosa]
MEILAEKLQDHGVLEGLGMDPTDGSGTDGLLLSLIVASEKMSGALGEDQRRRGEAAEQGQGVRGEGEEQRDSRAGDGGGGGSTSRSRWTTVRARILETVRRMNNASSAGDGSEEEGDGRGGGSEGPLAPAPAPSVTSSVVDGGGQPAAGVRGSMVSALFALIELKKAHWVKGIYFIYDVVQHPSSSSDISHDSVIASNLSRRIPFLLDSCSVPPKVLADFEACELNGSLETGTWNNEGGTIQVFLHNGGPVNWSSCHRALIVCEHLTEAQVGKCIADALEKYEEDIGGRDDAEFYLKHLPLRKGEWGGIRDGDGEEGKTEEAGEEHKGYAIVADFRTAICVGQELISSQLLAAPVEIRSFAGYAKWGRAQLLKEFLKKSWGAIYDGSKYLRKEIKDPRQASRAWEEAVGEATSVRDDDD